MDLIEKNSLYELFSRMADDFGNSFTGEAYRQAAKLVKQKPTVEAVPVIHGKWEEISEYNGWGDTYYRCSVCGEDWYLEDGKPLDNNMNFCPRCGAKMDGKGETD